MGPARASDAVAGRSPARGREESCPRPGLFKRLEASARVTVASAPPGSGKTVLLRSWAGEAGLAERPRGCRWAGRSGTRSGSGCRCWARCARRPRGRDWCGGDGGAGPGRVGDHRAAADGPGAAGGPALAGDRRHARAGAGRGAQPAGAADAWPRAGGPACCSTTGRRQRPRSRPSAERWPARARPPRARSARRSIARAGPGCVWTSHTPGCCTVNGCSVGGAGVRRAISFAARVMSSTLSAPESSPSGRWCFPAPRLAARWHRPCRIACAPRDRPQPGRPDRRRRTHRNGKVIPVIDRTYPLAQAAEAIRHLEQGQTRGRLSSPSKPRPRTPPLFPALLWGRRPPSRTAPRSQPPVGSRPPARPSADLD